MVTIRVLAVVHLLGVAVVGAAGGSPVARVLRTSAVLAVGGVCLVLHTHAVLPRTRPRGSNGRRLVCGIGLAASTTASTVIGLTHVSAGVSWRLLGAWAAMSSGGVLLVGSIVRAWQAAHRWRKLLVLPAVLLVVAFVVEPVGVAWYATARARVVPDEATPSDLGLAYEEVEMSTADGVRLSGWYLTSRNGAAVVALHGASSTRSAVLAQAAVLHRAGYGVVLLDARGHGRSDGTPMELGWYGDLDVSAAVDLLVARDDVSPDRIGVIGLSMGGEEAIGAAAADRRIRAVVAEGATNRTFADRDHWLPRGPAGLVQRMIDRVAFGLTDLVSPASPPMPLRDAATIAAPTPMLLIAGDGELAAAESIASGSPTTVQIWAAGAAHTRALQERPDEWQTHVLAFLAAALGPSTAS